MARAHPPRELRVIRCVMATSLCALRFFSFFSREFFLRRCKRLDGVVVVLAQTWDAALSP